jgi:hypothetical protein
MENIIYTWAVHENITKENITTSIVIYTDDNVEYINKINERYNDIVYIMLFWIMFIYVKKWILKFLNLFNIKIW